MARDYVNRSAHANGDHEEHREGCSNLPGQENRVCFRNFESGHQHELKKRVGLALVFLFAVSLLAVPLGDALGHSGGTNAQGCHNNHKTGGYHCH